MPRPFAFRLPGFPSVESRLLALALSLAAAAGCSSSDSTPNGPRAIQVTRVRRQVFENGTSATYVPGDISALSVAGATTSGGPSTWTVTGVPAGEYLLRVDWADGTAWFVRTSADAVDLSVEQGGYSAVFPTSPTAAALDLQGLDPWQVATDSLQVVSWDGFVYDFLLPTTPVDGDTAIAETFDWIDALLVPADRLFLAQYRYTLFNGGADAYEHAVAVTSVTGIAMTDGGTASIPDTGVATFSPTVDDATLSVTWYASAFETGMQAASQSSSDLVVFGAPPAAQEPAHYMSPDYLHLPVAVPASDLAISALPYSAFVPGFSKVLYAGHVAYVTRTAPGASSPRFFFPQTTVHAAATASTLAPLVTPPRTVQIQGLDAMLPQTGVGLTPTISWSAPQIGSPSRYQVVVRRLYASGTATLAATVATFSTRGTSVTVPSGLLALGQTYLATVLAYTGAHDEATPLADGLQFGTGSVVTQTFAP